MLRRANNKETSLSPTAGLGTSSSKSSEDNKTSEDKVDKALAVLLTLRPRSSYKTLSSRSRSRIYI